MEQEKLNTLKLNVHQNYNVIKNNSSIVKHAKGAKYTSQIIF